MLNIGDVCGHHGTRYWFKMNVIETYHSQVWQDDYTQGYSLFFSPVLNSTDRYILTIDSHTQAGSRVVEGVVPEPASLALLGAGLLGMGMARRRKA